MNQGIIVKETGSVMENGIESVLSIGTGFTKSGLVLTIVYSVVVFLVIKKLIRMVNRIMDNAIEKRGAEVKTSYNFINKVVEVILYAFAVVLVLSQFTAFDGVSTIVTASASVIGVAAALASQESMANFIGGMFLATMQPFKVGDLIVLTEKNITGTVTDIGLRHTTIRTFENTEMIVPNSVMNTAVIENRSSASHYSARIVFGISYDSDVRKAMQIIRELAENHPLALDLRDEQAKLNNAPKASVVCSELSSYSVNLRVSVPVKNASDGAALSSDLRLSVKEAFENEGISIPFPTMQIHSGTSQE